VGRRPEVDLWSQPAEPSLLRRPAAIPADVGALVVVVGVALPWVDYGDVGGSWLDGFSGAWGVIAVAAAAGLLLVLRSRSMMGSNLRLLLLLPASIGILSALVAINSLQSAQLQVQQFLESGTPASVAFGVYVAMLGLALCGIGGLASSLLAWREAAPSAAGVPGEPDLGFLLELVVCGLAGLGAGVAGGALGVSLFGSSMGVVLPMVVLSLAGAFTGAVVTERLWRRFIWRRSADATSPDDGRVNGVTRDRVRRG
jgi:hypothetical protein